MIEYLSGRWQGHVAVQPYIEHREPMSRECAEWIMARVAEKTYVPDEFVRQAREVLGG